MVQVLEDIKQSPTHTQKHTCINIAMEEQHTEATQWMQQTSYCNLDSASPPVIVTSAWQRTQPNKQIPGIIQYSLQTTWTHSKNNNTCTRQSQTNSNTFINMFSQINNTGKHCRPLPRACKEFMVCQLVRTSGNICRTTES